MNSTIPMDQFYDTFIKNFISVLGLIINYINRTFVLVFFQNTSFCSDPRYILYIHLVINDMIMLSIFVVATYVFRNFSVSVCSPVLLFVVIVTKNTTKSGLHGHRALLSICKLLHHPQICTVRRMYILILFIWTLSAVPAFSDIFITLSTQLASFFSTGFLCHTLFIYLATHSQRYCVECCVFVICVYYADRHILQGSFHSKRC